MTKNKVTKAKTEKKEKNRNGGFTMVEALLVAAILIILLAIGMVGILRYRDYLRITELDNMARSIYMAAQNRAVLLDNDRRFQTLVKGTKQPDGTVAGGCPRITFKDSVSGENKERWYIDSRDGAAADMLGDLLPTGTVDPTLRKGRFYIVYEPDSASVTDVFYVEKQDYDLNAAFASGTTAGIAGALDRLGADDKRENRMKNKPVMVGWFGSNAAAPRDKKLSKPYLEVLVKNDNELTVTVTYTLPADLPAGVTVTHKPTVKLKYDGAEDVVLMEADSSPFNGRRTYTPNIATNTFTYVWVLDSLAKDFEGKSQQFKDLWNGLAAPADFGGNFTVTASLSLTADGYKDSDEARDEKTGNSLFAEGSATGASDPSAVDNTHTAFIAKLRHLQNLDTAYSGAGGILTAEQTEDIDAGTVKNNKDDEISVDPSKGSDTKWKFIPIVNEKLTCYQDFRTRGEGGAEVKVTLPCAIANLTVTKESAAAYDTGVKKKNGAGLFGEVKGKGADDAFKFMNVRLVDSVVDGADKAAGVLAGSAENTDFTNCQVVSAEVSASIAGGLAGSTKAAEFTDCTVVEKAGGLKIAVTAEDCAGGMVGNSTGGSFTRCATVNGEVSGTDAGSMAGGMAGSTEAAEFTDCTVGETTGAKITVTAGSYAGGFAGNSTGGSFTRCAAVNAEVTSTAGIVGGISGYSCGDTVSFKTCQVSDATVESTSSIAGGLAGFNWGSTLVSFEDCGVNSLTVTSTSGSAGGFIGCKGHGSAEDVEEGSVRFDRCTVGEGGGTAITVAGGNHAGGLLGYTDGKCTAVFNDCTVGEAGGGKITVTGKNNAGGLAGNMSGGTFTGCQVVNAEVTGTDAESGAGGLAGRTDASELTGCTVGAADAKVTVTAGKYAGGLAGSSADGPFSGCKIVNTEVTGTNAGSIAGGLAGNTGAVRFADCAVGETGEEKVIVTGTNYAGGLAGNSWGTKVEFYNCQVDGTQITANGGGTFAGGMVGFNWGSSVDFRKCKVEDLTVGGGNSGGLMGYKSAGSVCFTDCTAGKEGRVVIAVTDGANAGGLLGCSDGNCEAKFIDCVVGQSGAGDRKNVSIEAKNAGGLLGCNEVGATPPEFTGCGAENITVSAVVSEGCAGGLAGNTVGAVFRNCGAENITVSAVVSAGRAGGLAGNTVGTVFRNCIAGNVAVTATDYAGALTGDSAGGLFYDCRASGADVSNTETNDAAGAGGLTGRAKAGAESIKFENCVIEQISVEGKMNAGGLAGETIAAQFTGCTAGKVGSTRISITAVNYAGGLTGNSSGGSFSNCTVVNADVTGTGSASEVGGLTGRLPVPKEEDGVPEAIKVARFSNSCKAADVTVKGTMSAGGAVGTAQKAEFENCRTEAAAVFAVIHAGGLTGRLEDGSFKNCTAVNAEVRASARGEDGSFDEGDLTGAAGGLAGTVVKASFEACSVYKDSASGPANNGGLTYQIAGTTAGGLVGTIENAARLQKSFAAACVQGKVYAGGLAGNFIGQGNGPDVAVQTSYADCYLRAGQSGVASFAGGLIGIKEQAVTLDFKNVYAAGFIEMSGDSAQVAGLCAGYATGTTAANAYAAMHYENVTVVQPLAFNVTPDDAAKCYFLNYSESSGGKTYAEMAAPAMVAAMNDGTGAAAAFEAKDGSDSHPYNLDGKTRSAYPFPGLKGLPHYGDWVLEDRVKMLKEPAPETGETVSGNGIPVEEPAPGSGETVSGNEIPEGEPAPGDGETVSGNEVPVEEPAPGSGETVSGNEIPGGEPAPGDGETESGGGTPGEEPAPEAGETKNRDETPDQTPENSVVPQQEAVVPPENDLIGDSEDDAASADGGGDTP